MQTQSFPVEVKALTEEGTFEGYASIFDNVDNGGDIVAPGAFAKSLKKGGRNGSVKMLWNHNPDEPIGIWDEFVEDSKGLLAKGRFILEVGRAKEVYALMKARAITGLSIGYRTIKYDIVDNIRVLKELDLWEVSPVTFPMNVQAKISGVKSEGMEEITEKLAAGDRLTEREFERLAKGLGLSNSQAERAARVHLKGQGEPVEAASRAQAFLQALRG